MKTYAGLTATALIAAATMDSAVGMKTYLQGLPNGSVFQQALGHPGEDSSKLSDFAKAFSAVDKTWTTAFCQDTFPGSSMTNGAAFGDPCCTWKKGGTPDFTVSPFTTTPGKATVCASGGGAGAGGSAAGGSKNSGTTETEPSGTTETEPSGTTETEPSGTTETEPSGTTETEPSGTTETEPSGTTESSGSESSGTTESSGDTATPAPMTPSTSSGSTGGATGWGNGGGWGKGGGMNTPPTGNCGVRRARKLRQ